MEEAKAGNLMDQKAVMIKELAEGIELVKQLRTRMLSSSSTNSNHKCLRDEDQALNYSLVDKMLSSFDKSISLAKLFNFDGLPRVHHSNSGPHSTALSCPSSEASSEDLRLSKKRKKMPPRIELVRVSPSVKVSGLEGPLNDGFTWRKYGQKDILGAKFPRAYYRCTHRYSQGCAATKQVQKSDEDPSIYQVIYKGEHTCTPVAQLGQHDEKTGPDQIKTEPQLTPNPQTQCQTAQSNQQEVSVGLPPDYGSKFDQPTGIENEVQIFQSFSFDSAQFEQGLIDDYVLSSSSTLWSPETADSNHFPATPSRISTLGVAWEADLSESTSGQSSLTNSPKVGDFGFRFDMLPDIDANFSFDFDALMHLSN